jgi:hypothetical protein
MVGMGWGAEFPQVSTMSAGMAETGRQAASRSSGFPEEPPRPEFKNPRPRRNQNVLRILLELHEALTVHATCSVVSLHLLPANGEG